LAHGSCAASFEKPAMANPEVDHRITLQTGAIATDGLCVEMLDHPTIDGGVLLKVLVRESLSEGEQCWLVDATGARIGAKVERIEHHSGDHELTLAATLPPDVRWRAE
jgi:hypothetical protein